MRRWGFYASLSPISIGQVPAQNSRRVNVGGSAQSINSIFNCNKFSKPQAVNMASIAAALAKALPKPQYTGEDEELSSRAQQRGPRILRPDQIDQTQITLRVGLFARQPASHLEMLTSLPLQRAGPPPYGQRAGWRPRGQEDFGDGGAFPEVLGKCCSRPCIWSATT